MENKAASEEFVYAVGEAIVGTFHREGLSTYRSYLNRFVPVEERRTLDELAQLYGCDKGTDWRNYTPIYSRYLESLRDRPITLLELGVARGASLYMWHAYFSQATIFGVDIDPQTPQALWSSARFNDGRVFIGDQENDKFLEEIAGFGPFDVIIDDCSHRSDIQIKCLEILFPTLNSGGLYFIEDLNESCVTGNDVNHFFNRKFAFANTIDCGVILTEKLTQYAVGISPPNISCREESCSPVVQYIESLHFHNNLVVMIRK